jgi:predicted Zn finger-like uncharacterized protein
MYTICPGCCTLFRVTAGQIGMAGGMVHCGECDHVYSAVDYLYEELPAAREALSGQQRVSAQIPSSRPARRETAWQGVATGKVRERDLPPVFDSMAQPLYTGGWRHEGISWKDVLKGASFGLLLLLLGFQWLYFNRAELSAQYYWRPALERMCGLMGCELPLRADPGQLELLDRDVRQHPQVEGALLINATFTNRSAFAQPYPVFQISFSNLAGTAVAVRRFKPSEYLADGVDIEVGIAPDALVRVVLEVQDPGEDAVSYQFGFF